MIKGSKQAYMEYNDKVVFRDWGTVEKNAGKWVFLEKGKSYFDNELEHRLRDILLQMAKYRSPYDTGNLEAIRIEWRVVFRVKKRVKGVGGSSFSPPHFSPLPQSYLRLRLTPTPTKPRRDER